MPSFPSSPTAGQLYTDGGVTYVYTGSKWKQDILGSSYRGEIATASNNQIVLDLSQSSFFELSYSSNTVVSFTNPPINRYAQAFQVLVSAPTSEGFSLLNASYDNISSPFTVATTSIPTSPVFDPTGTKIFHIQATGAASTVRRYTLTTPWRLDTMQSDLTSFAVTTQEANAVALAFDTTGTKMYISGSINDTVYAYNLSTAWDVTTAVYATQSFPHATYDGTGLGLSFKPDGTMMYISGNGTDSIYQFSLSTPWNVSTASYTNKFKLLSAQDTTIAGHAFNTDGTKLFVNGMAGDNVYQYNLSTAWDVSTAVYSSIFFYVGAQETTPYGIHFKPGGDKMYILGSTTDIFYQYSTIASSAVLTWPSNIVWQQGRAPVITPGKQHAIEFRTSNGGVTYFASTVERDIE